MVNYFFFLQFKKIRNNQPAQKDNTCHFSESYYAGLGFEHKKLSFKVTDLWLQSAKIDKLLIENIIVWLSRGNFIFSQLNRLDPSFKLKKKSHNPA